MEITCSQMDVLISFYLEGDLSKALKSKVEEHLKTCPVCKAKYEIIKSMLSDLRNSFEEKELIEKESNFSSQKAVSQQYRVFKENLSAYIDNELPSNESIKIKKFTINNKTARKELEDTYNIRKLMNESFEKTKCEAKQDFTRNIIRQLDPNEDQNLSLHPVIKVATAFVFTVLTLSALVIFSLTL